MDSEIAHNQNYDDHYADDTKDVHSVSLHSMMARDVHAPAYLPLAKRVLSPPSVSPIAASSEEQK